jgi:hypothetical protein
MSMLNSTHADSGSCCCPSCNRASHPIREWHARKPSTRLGRLFAPPEPTHVPDGFALAIQYASGFAAVAAAMFMIVDHRIVPFSPMGKLYYLSTVATTLVLYLYVKYKQREEDLSISRTQNEKFYPIQRSNYHRIYYCDSCHKIFVPNEHITDLSDAALHGLLNREPKVPA